MKYCIGVKIGGYSVNSRKSSTLPLNPVAHYSAKGKTNQDVDRDVLKDLSGNGCDIYLRNFGYTPMSGYSNSTIEHYIDFSKWKIDVPDSVNGVITKNKAVLTINAEESTGLWSLNLISLQLQSDMPTYAIKVSGNLPSDYVLGWTELDAGDYVEQFVNSPSGVFLMNANTVNQSLEPGKRGTINFYISNLIGTNVQTKINTTLTIEVIDHPDGLVFDGVDDYGIGWNQPALTDYTVIAKRIIVGGTPNGSFLSKWYNGSVNVSFGAFIVDRSVSQSIYVYSFGSNTGIASSTVPPLIVVQTTNSYNGMTIPKGIYTDTPWLAIGATQIKNEQGDVSEYLKCILYDVIIYDRTLTSKEIESEIKKYKL